MVETQNKHVQGYLYRSTDDDPRHDTVCQIVGRVQEEGSLRENGPMFRVKFGDGVILTACGDDLKPWFPVD